MLNVKADFPFCQMNIDEIYVDNAATSQKPIQVINAITEFYQHKYATVHRGFYQASTNATKEYEHARTKVATFFNVPTNSISFNSGATAGINTIANHYQQTLTSKDEIIISQLEHHSNYLPWVNVAAQTGAKLLICPSNVHGTLDLRTFTNMLSTKTKIVAVTAVSNVLGTLNPLATISHLVHQTSATLLIDGAQAAPEIPLDLTSLAVDFFAFSGHKMLAPTGIGGLYIAPHLAEQIQPAILGGEMVLRINGPDYQLQQAPLKFEAGTPNISGAIGLGVAIDYLTAINMQNVHQHCKSLAQSLTNLLAQDSQFQLLSPIHCQTGIVSFNLRGVHPHDLATFLASHNIDSRAGTHCAQPLYASLSLSASVRISFYIYNSTEEVIRIWQALQQAEDFFNEFTRNL